jgi:hypothetical protein
MPNFNKSRGFQMKGFSYPGESPLKGKKKTAEKLAAKERKAEAMGKINEFGEMEMASTDILAKDSFKVDAGSSPATKRSPAKNWLGTMISSIGKAAATETGQEIGKAGINAVIGEGAKLLTRKKEKKESPTGTADAFSGIKLGTK